VTKFVITAAALFWLSSLGLVGSAFAEDAASTTGNGTLTGNPVYQKQCAKCHGKSAEGRHFGGPALSSEKVAAASAEKVAAASADDLRNIISNGKGRMPKYNGKLSAEEINRLILELKAPAPKPQ
jgi:mono/diheme cytochrome c family protein